MKCRVYRRDTVDEALISSALITGNLGMDKSLVVKNSTTLLAQSATRVEDWLETARTQEVSIDITADITIDITGDMSSLADTAYLRTYVLLLNRG